jgi:hypothetical protein
LRTPLGFWNIIAHRGVFYGSQFVLEHDTNFESLETWQELRQSPAFKNKADKYFCNGNAYGPNNFWRSLDRLEDYWNNRHRWTIFLEQNPTPTITLLFNFLLEEIPNSNRGKEREDKPGEIDKRSKVGIFKGIGDLTALLICGDCIYAGLIHMPTKEEMGFLVARMRKGATTGLANLRLIPDKHSSEVDIRNAFVGLYDYLDVELTTEEKEAIGFDVLMLEHSLCKYTRLVRDTKK